MKKEKMKDCEMTREVIDLLADLIKNDKSYSDCEISTYGPLGLCNESGIFVKRDGHIIGDLNVIDGDDETRFLRRTYEQVRNYPPGSIGAMNGMNYNSVPLPEDNETVLRLVFAKTEGAETEGQKE